VLFRIAILIAITFGPSKIYAQILTVRSGEHSNFTRLVVPIITQRDWSITQEERVVTLTLDQFDGEFDTTEVFQLIPRDRIVSLTSISGQLEITLGCDCNVAYFLAENRFVVLDIGPQDVELFGTTVVRTTTAQELPSVGRIEISPEVAIPLPSLLRQAEAALTQTPVDTPLRIREPLSAGENAILDVMQEKLLRELSTAATRGVLNTLADQSIAPKNSDTQETTNVDIILAQPEITKEEPNKTTNVRVTSSNELQRIDAPALYETSYTCPNSDDFNVEDWADSRPFNIQIGEARKYLYRDFNKLDLSSIDRLAKLYLFFGFGSEARAVLSLKPEMSASSFHLVDIAHILERGEATAHSTLSGAIECESEVALWAILAETDIPAERNFDPSAALRALNKLPIHLRRSLAPELSERLLSYGDADSAAKALRSIERVPLPLPPSAKMANASIALEQGNYSSATNQLSDVIKENTTQSPEALIALVEAKFSQNEPVLRRTANLLEAYAKELGNSELGPALRRSNILALAKSGQFDRAFQAIEEVDGQLEVDLIDEIRLKILEEVTASAENITFLEYFFEQAPREVNRLSSDAKNSLANRLLDLGFSNEAQAVLSNLTVEERNANGKVQETEFTTNLDTVDNTGPNSDLSGTDSLQVSDEQAQSGIGSLENISRSSIRIDGSGAPLNPESLAQDLDISSFSENPVFETALELQSSAIEIPNSQIGLLERSSTALDESVTARNTIRNLLDQSEVGIDSEISER